jgi:pseudaminic acid biosynthesis-associated methylase
MTYETGQEKFWAGEFGDDYIDRNSSAQLLASNLKFFSQALHRCGKINTVLELGANVGMNLRALAALYPTQTQTAVEINKKAVALLRENLPHTNVFQKSIHEFATVDQFDLVVTKGVLIHINPVKLNEVYELMYQASKRYILIAEYFNTTPLSIEYRGNSDKLFKRDFCGDILDMYPDLNLIDYGFCYKRDASFQQDNITWFLIEK